MHEDDLSDTDTRENQLQKTFQFSDVQPRCVDEYVRIPLDIPWKEMSDDVQRAYDKFGWYGMVHRKSVQWKRSVLYGGLGLTYNPDYAFDVDRHAQGLGQPRSNEELSVEQWVDQTTSKKYEPTRRVTKNTYNDALGLRYRNDVTRFRSFKTFFDMIKFNMFQGRIAEIRPHNVSHAEYEQNKDFIWHVDEKNELVTRLLIPLVYSDDYYIEFKESGNRIYFEPGYAYHWNTRMVHRWGYDYHPKIQDRTCIVLGVGPWLSYEDRQWSTNEYFNNMHPTDMIRERVII